MPMRPCIRDSKILERISTRCHMNEICLYCITNCKDKTKKRFFLNNDFLHKPVTDYNYWYKSLALPTTTPQDYIYWQPILKCPLHLLSCWCMICFRKSITAQWRWSSIDPVTLKFRSIPLRQKGIFRVWLHYFARYWMMRHPLVNINAPKR